MTAALALGLILTGCAPSRLEALETEVVALRHENNELSGEVERLAERVTILETTASRPATPPPPELPPPAWLLLQDDGSYAVSRDLLPSVDELVMLGRMIPHRGYDGEIDGYRISGLRSGSAPHLLGFRNGDILNAVGGTPIVDVATLSEAYRQMTLVSAIQVDLTRRGQPETLVIQVR